ncbi:MAG: hypothetical protein BroJett031_25310 [Betaproteobacteria bacterium]|nr:MAG: hypothetical protein BroJett031_25310 [Betaproteobacteria bacterium]
MKTDELIAMLANGLEPVERGALARAFSAALALGLPLSTALMIAFLGFNPSLRTYLAEPMFWTKFGFGLALALASLWMAARLARPGARVSSAALLPLAPIAGLWLLAAPVLVSAAPAERAALMWGETWRTCITWIPLLSAPVLVGALLALRKMAPTRPALAGAAAGALAGGAGAAIYALHCPELAAPFLAIWYVIGASIPTLAGALIGRRALRW